MASRPTLILPGIPTRCLRQKVGPATATGQPHSTPGHDTGPTGTGRADTGTASKKTGTGPPTAWSPRDTRRNTTHHPRVLAARTPGLLRRRQAPGRQQRRETTQVPKALAARTPGLLQRRQAPGRPQRWTTYNTTRTARSVLGSTTCVDALSPDRTPRPGADLDETRSEGLPLLPLLIHKSIRCTSLLSLALRNSRYGPALTVCRMST